MKNSSTRYSEEVRIPGYLCTTEDCLSLPGIASLFQEAAWKHAAILGFAFTEEDTPVYWVLSRITIRVDRLPVWDDRVVIRTWPSGTHRLYATRELLIEKDGDVLVAGGSSWIILDADSGRPVKPDLYLKGRHTVQEHVLVQDFGKVTALELDTAPVTTPWNDVPPMALDRNMHVNNTKYLEWLVNASYGTPFQSAVADPSGHTVVMTYNAETTLEHAYRVVMDPSRGRADVQIRNRNTDDATKNAWSLFIRPSKNADR